MRTWNKGILDTVITKVFMRIKIVLCNIIEANGGNDLVESKRGVSYKHIKVEETIRTMQREDKHDVTDLLGDDMGVEEEDGVVETEVALVNMSPPQF